YAHLALLQQRGCFALFRAHQRLIVSFAPGRPHVPPSRRPRPGEAGLPRARGVPRLGRGGQGGGDLKPPGGPAPPRPPADEALAEPPRVRGPAGGAAGARAAGRGAGAGLPGAGAHAGDDAAGPAALPQGGGGEAVRAALVGGDEPEAPQGDAGDGRAAVRDVPGGGQGAVGRGGGLQAGGGGDGGGGAEAAGGAGEGQLRGRAAVAAGGGAGGGVAPAEGEPAAPGPRGAACEEAPAQAVRPDEQTAGRAARRPAP